MGNNEPVLRPGIREALTSLETWVRERETDIDGEVWLSLAVLYHTLGWKDSANIAFEKSTVAPYATMRFIDRIMQLCEHGRIADAEALVPGRLQDLTSLTTENELDRIYVDVACVYIYAGRFDEALEMIARVSSETKRKRYQVTVAAYIIEIESDIEKAKSLVHQYELGIEGNLVLVKELFRTGRIDEARLIIQEIREQCNELDEEDIHTRGIRWHVAHTLAPIGEWDFIREQIDRLEAGTTQYKLPIYADLEGAIYYTLVHDFEKALVHAERMTTYRDPPKTSFLTRIAREQAKVGQIDPARALLKRVKDKFLVGKDISEKSELAFDFAKIGDKEEALSLWNAIYSSLSIEEKNDLWAVPFLKTMTTQAEEGLAFADSPLS